MTKTPDDIVRTEVHYCISYLVSTLANRPDDGPRLRSAAGDALADLCWQAIELSCPIDDWEEAAIQAGWQMEGGNVVHKSRDGNNTGDDEEYASNWREACDISGVEPYQREVYEHWIVSDWLADQLEALGEKVDKDFAGLTVWARTTTGQGVASDSVIEAIAANLNRPDPSPADSAGRQAVLKNATRII